MNRFLRGFFSVIAFAVVALAALAAWEFDASGLSILRAKTFWALAFGGAVFAVAAWRLPVQTRFQLFLLLLAFGFIELLLQALCWTGVMPAINTKENVPFGRVYWTSEGRGNSLRNRYAWHFPPFHLDRTNRIAVIGDSFVEAVEVSRSRTVGAALRARVEPAESRRTVMSFAMHGTGPAHYLELLAYAQRHFAIKDAVIVCYLGNDFVDVSPGAAMHDPRDYIYYGLATNQTLSLDATGEQTRARFAAELEWRHRPWPMFLPRILASHCMTAQLPLSVLRARATRKQMQSDARTVPMDAALARLGLKAEPFAVNQSPQAREAAAILKALFAEADEFARKNAIQLRVVTVPFFPPDFYAQNGRDWKAQVGEHDFFLPDRDLAEWAKQRSVPFLSLGDRMKERGFTTDEIRRLYLTHGSGHFSEAGHQFAAEEIERAFFAVQKR
jgi:hypothetical protein